jgi:hypothetical protein
MSDTPLSDSDLEDLAKILPPLATLPVVPDKDLEGRHCDLYPAREYSDDNFMDGHSDSISMLTRSLHRQANSERDVPTEGLEGKVQHLVDPSTSAMMAACETRNNLINSGSFGEPIGNKGQLPHVEDDGRAPHALSLSGLTDKALSMRLAGYRGDMTSVNLSNASLLQGLFLDTLPSTIVHLDLTGCRSLTNEYLTSFIAKFYLLESLYLVGCPNLTDSTLEMIVECCSRLESIAVPPGTTDNGLVALARLPNLRRVGIRGCDNITLQGIRSLLRGKPDLERVVVSKCMRVSQNNDGMNDRGEEGEGTYGTIMDGRRPSLGN